MGRVEKNTIVLKQNSERKIKGLISIYSTNVNIQEANKYVYTGIEFAVPEKSIAIVTADAIYVDTYPYGISIATSKETCDNSTKFCNSETYPAKCTVILPSGSYYIWAKYREKGINYIKVDGIVFSA